MLRLILDFDGPIINQINLRQVLLGNNPVITSDPSVQNWKFNNSAWIRLASSVNLDIQADSNGNITGKGVDLIKKLIMSLNDDESLPKSYVEMNKISMNISKLNRYYIFTKK